MSPKPSSLSSSTSATDRVLVVAAHPDDEVLGAGATIAKYAAAGAHVHVLIMAEGLTSRDSKRDRGKRAAELDTLGRASREANEVLGVTSLELLGFPDNRMDSVDRLDITKDIERVIAEHRPTVVFTHHSGDVNIDHRQIFDAVIAACRPLPNQSVRQLLFFEVNSSTEWQPPAFAHPFVPNYFVDATATLQLKLDALKCYAGEMRPWPHSRSIAAVEHLARVRGASVGRDAAEAFVVGRILA